MQGLPAQEIHAYAVLRQLALQTFRFRRDNEVCALSRRVINDVDCLINPWRTALGKVTIAYQAKLISYNIITSRLDDPAQCRVFLEQEAGLEPCLLHMHVAWKTLNDQMHPLLSYTRLREDSCA